jgi:hypothetical protein
MLELIPLSFATGALAKFSDIIADDGLDVNPRISFPLAACYGFLLAYIISNYPVLSPLVTAVVLGVVFTGKIDHGVHYTGIASMFFFLSVFGIQPVNMYLLLVFVAAGVIDEIGSDRADRGHIKGLLGKSFVFRPVLEVTAFVISLLTGEWVFFISMLSADAGYIYLFKERHVKAYFKKRIA